MTYYRGEDKTKGNTYPNKSVPRRTENIQRYRVVYPFFLSNFFNHSFLDKFSLESLTVWVDFNLKCFQLNNRKYLLLTLEDPTVTGGRIDLGLRAHYSTVKRTMTKRVDNIMITSRERYTAPCTDDSSRGWRIVGTNRLGYLCPVKGGCQ